MFLNGEVHDALSTVIVAQLLFLDSLSQKPISFYINSPGGSVTAGMAIYDTVWIVKSAVGFMNVSISMTVS